jgi:transmembrane 9 superfamily protein 2/4
MLQLAAVGLLPLLAHAWYLPGTAPTDYQAGQAIPLLVNPVSPLSDAAQVHSVLSYDYYSEPFHFCRPADGPKAQSESLGSILFGDRLFDSPFELASPSPHSQVPDG